MTMHLRALPPGAIELKDDDDDPVSVVTKKLEEFTTSFGETKKALETDLAATKADLVAQKKRADDLELKMARPNVITTKEGEPTDEQKAFDGYLRHGDRAPELKTLQVGIDPQGGYLAPPETSEEMIRSLVQFSPIRSIASVRQTSAPSVIYPKRTGVTNGKWKGETQAQEGSEPAFGQAEIPTRELNTFVDISNQLLADSGGKAEQEVRLALSEDFGQKEGLAFVKGDGVLAPEGFMANADVAYHANGHATNLSADALLTLFYAMPAMWRNRGSWVMNGTTLGVVRKLKDASSGDYLWQPGIQAGQPETLLGRPVIEAIDMDDVAADKFPIIYGDFSAAYRIVDRLQMSVLVNPYLLATNGITRIHATRRVGGAVLQSAALRKLKMATS